MDDVAATAEFLDSLSFTHRIIYRRKKTCNALRAWIVFYERVLINDNVRLAVQNNGYEPWELLDYPTADLTLKKFLICDCLDIYVRS